MISRRSNGLWEPCLRLRRRLRLLSGQDQPAKDADRLAHVYDHPLWKSFIQENFMTQPLSPSVIDEQLESKVMRIKGQMLVHRAIARCIWGGHIQASLDPLDEAREKYTVGPWLPKNAYCTAALLPYSNQEMIRLPHSTTLVGGSKKWLSVQHVFTKLKYIYSNTIGVEELQQKWEVENWVSRRLERKKQNDSKKKEDSSSRLVTLRRLVQAHTLEDWVLKNHPQLTSGLGAEIVSVALQSLSDAASLFHAQHFNLCMSTTRGRLNVMLNGMRKPTEHVLAPLEDFSLKGRFLDMSDRTSLGVNSSKVSSRSNDPLVLNLLANVSKYPDSQIALLQGKSKADRLFLRDYFGNKVWPIIMHGAGAITSHGKVFEMMRLNFSPLFEHRGAIHLVISDKRQLGARKSEIFVESPPYCTDIIKGVNGLILHVNASDIDAVNFCIEMAVDYKARFLRSALVNLVCTPENRAQEPVYFWKSVFGHFTQSLINTGKTTTDHLWRSIESLHDFYTSKYNLREFNFMDWVDSPWKKSVTADTNEPLTGISVETLENGLKTIKEFNEKYDIHESIKKALEERVLLAANGQINWPMAEALAIFTLVNNRVNIRLTGEEVLYPKRSFKNLRLWRLSEMNSWNSHTFLDHVITKAKFTATSVPGSQTTLLEYELGFDMANPRCLSIWQGSEGSLSRIQYLIDVYIAGGEVRWIRQTSLLMLFFTDENEGKVWRKENCAWRFLCNTQDEPNVRGDPSTLHAMCHMVVMCPSMPSNYFHALMRQVNTKVRKPAAIFISTSLFTSNEFLSKKDDFLTTTKFVLFIGDDNVTPDEVVRVIFCCGSIYYLLFKERASQGLDKKVALCRVEQISPFPYKAVAQELTKFKNAQIVWAQLEPHDKAWYQYVKPRIEACADDERNCHFIGRQSSFYKDFIENLNNIIINEALTLKL